MGALAGACVPQRPLVLEAIAAERMPQTLIVHGVAPSAFFELRDYGASVPRVVRVLERCGIHAVSKDRDKLLFGFSTLEERETAWRLAASNEDWVAVRDSVVLKELAVYAPVSPH